VGGKCVECDKAGDCEVCRRPGVCDRCTSGTYLTARKECKKVGGSRAGQDGPKWGIAASVVFNWVG